MKPEKYTWKEFLNGPIAIWYYTLLKDIFDWWYCDECKEYHSPRVKKFSKSSLLGYRQYCSIWIETEEE